MNGSPNRRIFLIALAVLALDQITKFMVLSLLPPSQERVVLDGFFKFVHWENTGAAWSFFTIAIISWPSFRFWRWRAFFSGGAIFIFKTLLGQISLGLIFGGIAGNLVDRLRYHKVIDFLRFYLDRRGGEEIGFPAFNMADSAICVGVGLLILVSWKQEHENASAKPASVP
jgi:signal peptidase II